MKRVRSILALALALVLVLAMSTAAFAAPETYSITVNNTNPAISINGNTYNAYKILDATYDKEGHVSYTVSTEFANFTYTVGGNNYQGEALIAYLGTLTNDSDALDAFAKAALTYATTNSIQPAGTATAANETATISVPAPGYYLVSGTATAPDNQTVTAACSLTTAKPNAEVNVKADAPSVDKKIVEGNSDVSANDASIGDSVNYKITSRVPNMKGYTKYFFVMEDTLSKGLTYNKDMVITIGAKALVKDTDYTLTVTENADGTTSLEIVFKNFIQYKGQTNAAITLTYSATLNQDAVLDPTTGNPNTVKLIYSNNPNQEGEGTFENPDKPKPGTPVGETPTVETKTYVTGLKLTKVDGKAPGKTLTGAKFEIKGTGMKVVLINKTMYKASANGTYYMLKDGTYTETAPVTDKNADGYNADLYDDVNKKYEKVTVVDKTTDPTEINATGYVDENGVLTFEGLGEGTYTITELVAPNGYNLLKDPVTITITANATLEGCTWTVKNGETGLPAGADHLFAFNVENNSGTELPSTGGTGTTIFYILGSLLVVVAGVVLVTRKRMNASEN